MREVTPPRPAEPGTESGVVLLFDTRERGSQSDYTRSFETTEMERNVAKLKQSSVAVSIVTLGGICINGEEAGRDRQHLHVPFTAS